MIFEAIRARAQGWVAWLIIGILCASFALWGVQYYLTNQHRQPYAAKVGKHEISQAVVKQTAQRLQSDLRRHMAQAQLPSLHALEAFALEQLITQYMLADAAQNSGMTMAPRYLQQALLQISAFQEKGQFSPERFQSVLRQSGDSPEHFMQRFAEQVVISEWRAGLLSSAFVLPHERQAMLHLLQQKRDVLIATLQPNQQTVAPVSQSAIKAFYQQHAESFMTPDSVRYAYIDINPAQQSDGAVSEADMRAYYQTHLARFQHQRRVLLERLFLPVDAKSDQQHAVLTAAQGGRALSHWATEDGYRYVAPAWVDWTALPAALQQKLTTAKKRPEAQRKGPMIGAYQDDSGQQIYHIVHQQAAQHRPFATVRTEIKAALLAEAKAQAASQMLDQLTEASNAHPDRLAPLAQLAQTPIKYTGWLTAKQSLPKVLTNPAVQQALQSAAVQAGQNSLPVQTTAGHVVVVRIAARRSPVQQPFNMVKDDIRRHLVQRAQQAKVLMLGERWQKALQTGQPLPASANLKWQLFKAVTLTDKRLPDAVRTALFTLPAQAAQDQAVAGVSLADGRYTLMRMQAVHYPKAKRTPTQRAQAAHALQSAYADLLYRHYIASVRHRTKIKHATH